MVTVDYPVAAADAAKRQAITTKIGKTDPRRDSFYLAFGDDVLRT